MENTDLPVLENIKTLHKYDTIYSADSVEWCPHEPNQNLFVCGNYQLTEEQEFNSNNKRLGRILLFTLTTDLKLLQTLDTAAVLDQKWCPNQINGSSILGVVNAKRALEIYKLQNSFLVLVTKYTFLEDQSTETLILSLDWSTGKTESQHPHVACSDSKGNIHLLQLINNELVMEKSWHGHDFQAWITGFYYWDPNIIFSGGDDAVFLKFDKRAGDSPVAKNKQHETGVTSFHSNKSKEFLVATGSYDEHVRLWDVRSIKNPLNQLKMPGGVWRLKWDPFSQRYLLAACMFGGLHVMEAQSDKMVILDSYYEHKNITYGADWSFLNCNGNVIIGSCSFYDHLLCVSNFTCDF
ncbi:unnamed protein product [Ceutorhynchus assimilis]|uniref:methylated diphthine methylhydrolase n=1 Tax=Ceutorhynchus assimilis TaxID=467358 RepID=A0A9N9MMA4_9CUCU|nr:unnamed protein product [Ceutorhynchus assimilis]